MSACPFRAQLDEWQPRIRALAWRRIRRGGCYVDLDDLVQVGRIGLWRAVERYDGVREFEPFAVRTIYCHMLEEIRGHDCLKAHVRAAGLVKVVHVEYDDDLDSRADQSTPYDIAEFSEGLHRLRDYLPLLPDRWQMVLRMRYDDGMEWHEIGKACGHTLSWAFKIGREAHKTLRRWVELGRAQPLSHRAGKEQHHAQPI